MNLQKLFETQKVLRDRIGYNGEDRFEKLILALLVEIGECANEWRGFKFWSKDQEPRRELIHRDPHGQCADVVTNPLLEEYVDGLHFVLELGIEVDFKSAFGEIETEKFGSVLEQFNIVYYAVFKFKNKRYFYSELLGRYLALGEMLGFTWEQIEEAYYAKNQVNHERQNTGY